MKIKPKDYTGRKIGLLTPIRRTSRKHSDGSYLWEVKCSCGKKLEVPACRFSRIYSCGCEQRPNSGRIKPLDLSYYKNEMAKTLYPTLKRNSGGYIIWALRCDCGKVFERPAYDITRKTVKSCGCTKFLKKLGRPRREGNLSHVWCVYSKYKKSAKLRRILFELDFQEFQKIIESNCFYCGDAPKFKSTHKYLNGKYAWTGVDRIDSKHGYIKGNVVPCCTYCNWAKRDLSTEDFKNLIFRIYHHFCC